MSNDDNKYRGMKAFPIARVSEESQIKALPAQKRNLESYRDKLGLVGEIIEFNEAAYKEEARKKFDDVVKEIEKYPNLCIVIFDKIDRFSRDYSAEVVRIFKYWAKHGKIEIHFVSDNLVISKDSPATDIAKLGMGMVFGEYYSAAIGDNVKRRQKDKIANGEYPGKVHLGYKNITVGYDARGDKITDVVIDEERAPFVKRAYELRAEGYSFRWIGRKLREEGFLTRELKPVSNATVEYILKDKWYIGEATFGSRKIKLKYPPLFDKRLWYAVQTVNEQKGWTGEREKRKDGSDIYTYEKRVHCCEKCGGLMSSYPKKGHIYLRCSNQSECGNCGCAESIVDEQIIKVLERLRISEDDAEKMLSLLKGKYEHDETYFTHQLAQITEEYERLEGEIDEAYDDKLKHRITVERFERIEEMKTKRMRELDMQKEKLVGNRKDFIVDVPYLLELAKRAPELFKSSRSGLKNKLLQTIFSNLTLYQKRVDFTLLAPLDSFFFQSKTCMWLPGLDSNQ